MPPADLRVRADLVIPGEELEESACASGGPGGQHANKTSTKVALRWSVRDSAVLQEAWRARLLERLAPRLTTEGELVVTVETHRSQFQNREAARERLAGLVRAALHVPRRRRPTQPTRTSRERRLQEKRVRSRVKKERGKPEEE